MSPKIKNSLIFAGIGTVFILIYVFFIKGSSDETSTLVSSSGPIVQTTTASVNQNSSITEEFLASLLNVTNIKLNDAIFGDDAFISLHDSSIVLIPDGDEGRPNPFAPFGIENFTPPASTATPQAATTPTTTAPPTPPSTIKPPTTSTNGATTPPPTTPLTPKTP